MGKGKGTPYAWTTVKKSTSILLEMSRRQHNLALINKLFRISALKLPVKTKFVIANPLQGGRQIFIYQRLYGLKVINFSLNLNI